MSPALALRLNAFGLLAVGGVLGFAFADQIFFRDLPCPLCLLQRVGLMLAGFGLALNLRFGARPGHYGLMIIAAVAGGAVSVRQILLHIVPGSGSYGNAFLELHFYTWALIVFVLIVLGAAVMLLFDGQFEKSAPASGKLQGLSLFAFAVFALLVVANGAATFLECGLGLCPDDPTRYEMLDKLRKK
jgi:disulfide bond formation protein DsbB